MSETTTFGNLQKRNKRPFSFLSGFPKIYGEILFYILFLTPMVMMMIMVMSVYIYMVGYMASHSGSLNSIVLSSGSGRTCFCLLAPLCISISSLKPGAIFFSNFGVWGFAPSTGAISTTMDGLDFSFQWQDSPNKELWGGGVKRPISSVFHVSASHSYIILKLTGFCSPRKLSTSHGESSHCVTLSSALQIPEP